MTAVVVDCERKREQARIEYAKRIAAEHGRAVRSYGTSTPESRREQARLQKQARRKVMSEAERALVRAKDRERKEAKKARREAYAEQALVGLPITDPARLALIREARDRYRDDAYKNGFRAQKKREDARAEYARKMGGVVRPYQKRTPERDRELSASRAAKYRKGMTPEQKAEASAKRAQRRRDQKARDLAAERAAILGGAALESNNKPRIRIKAISVKVEL